MAKLSPTVRDAINEQIRSELYAAYLYLAMSGWCETSKLPGYAKWLRAQSQEEVGHAMRLHDFLHARGSRVVLEALEKPRAEFASPLDVATAALEHEQKVSQSIYDLYELANREKDYATQAQLQWFLNEQVEEESTASDIVDRWSLAGESPGAWLVVDRELAARAVST